MAIRALFAGLVLAGVLFVGGTAHAVAPPPRPDDRQVAFELRIVSVSNTGFKRLCIGKDSPSVHLLDGAGVDKLLEAMQNDHATELIDAFHIEAPVGTRGQVAIGRPYQFVTGVPWLLTGLRRYQRSGIVNIDEDGLMIDLKTDVSTDGRTIRLDGMIEYSFPNPQALSTLPTCWGVLLAAVGRLGKGPEVHTPHTQKPNACTFKLDRALSIPAGKTALLTGRPCDRHVEREVYLSLFGYLPWVGDLLRMPLRVTQREYLFLLITPRLVGPEAAPAAE